MKLEEENMKWNYENTQWIDINYQEKRANKNRKKERSVSVESVK